MTEITAIALASRILVALGCGVAIGFERQWRQRSAGLRTNALVAVGASLFVIMAALTPHEASPTRVAAQVASGVGFLGAGVIMRNGFNVHGLNTASTIWCAAGVGILAGSGFYLPALMGTGAVLSINYMLRPVAAAVNRRSTDRSEQPIYYRLKLYCPVAESPTIRTQIVQFVANSELTLMSLESLAVDNRPETCKLDAVLACVERRDDVLEQLNSVLDTDVESFSWRIGEAA